MARPGWLASQSGALKDSGPLLAPSVKFKKNTPVPPPFPEAAAMESAANDPGSFNLRVPLVFPARSFRRTLSNVESAAYTEQLRPVIRREASTRWSPLRWRERKNALKRRKMCPAGELWSRDRNAASVLPSASSPHVGDNDALTVVASG